jgi:hypothetical protein
MYIFTIGIMIFNLMQISVSNFYACDTKQIIQF